MSWSHRPVERGSAMLITMIIIGALLAGAAVVVSMQMSSNRSTDLTRTGVSALYCAEAGLAAAHPTVAANYSQWAASLGSATQPAWLDNTVFSHDLDGDGVDDFTITIKDNDDEIAPAANVPGTDIDLKIFIVSTCTKYLPDNPKQVTELIQYTGGGTCYQSQEGGCGGNGNSN